MSHIPLGSLSRPNSYLASSLFFLVSTPTSLFISAGLLLLSEIFAHHAEINMLRNGPEPLPKQHHEGAVPDPVLHGRPYCYAHRGDITSLHTSRIITAEPEKQ